MRTTLYPSYKQDPVIEPKKKLKSGLEPNSEQIKRPLKLINKTTHSQRRHRIKINEQTAK